jgi:hypothetical protein
VKRHVVIVDGRAGLSDLVAVDEVWAVTAFFAVLLAWALLGRFLRE